MLVWLIAKTTQQNPTWMREKQGKRMTLALAAQPVISPAIDNL
jgi:hypothetical protein